MHNILKKNNDKSNDNEGYVEQSKVDDRSNGKGNDVQMEDKENRVNEGFVGYLNGKGRIGFARVLVEIDAEKEIKDRIEIVYKGRNITEGTRKVEDVEILPSAIEIKEWNRHMKRYYKDRKELIDVIDEMKSEDVVDDDNRAGNVSIRNEVDGIRG
nr:hypothetical protein [Tanacetum cinerariifolium]